MPGSVTASKMREKSTTADIAVNEIPACFAYKPGMTPTKGEDMNCEIMAGAASASVAMIVISVLSVCPKALRLYLRCPPWNGLGLANLFNEHIISILNKIEQGGG